MFRLAVVSALLLAPAIATASSGFLNNIPNGLNIGCDACHTQQPNLNPFGQAYRASSAWSTLWMLDSDGDGQQNGAELGDPCGVWRPGQQPGRTNNISNPGSAASMSTTPNVPACGPPDAGVIDTGVIDTGVRDMGVPPGDTGVRDTGAGGPDAGPARDGGTVIADGGVIEESGGCTCYGMQQRSGDVSALLLVLGLLVGTRRRVRSTFRRR